MFRTNFFISSRGIYFRIFINIMFNPQWSPTVQLLLGWLLVLEVVANQGFKHPTKHFCMCIYFDLGSFQKPQSQMCLLVFTLLFGDLWGWTVTTRISWLGDPELKLHFFLDRQITIRLMSTWHVIIAGVDFPNDPGRWYFVHNKQQRWIFNDISPDLKISLLLQDLRFCSCWWSFGFLGSFSTLPVRFRRPIDMFMAMHGSKNGKHPVSQFLGAHSLFNPTICQPCRAHLETENMFPQKPSTFLIRVI